MATSCCPPSALGYLASDTACTGSKVDLGEGVEFYQTGSAGAVAIILFPDGKRALCRSLFPGVIS